MPSTYFDDGAPLTGQSKHLANLQIGLEDQDGLSQQTILVSYASKRVTSRGINGTGQPDVIEYPGVQLDFVARQGIKLFGVRLPSGSSRRATCSEPGTRNISRTIATGSTTTPTMSGAPLRSR